MKKHSYATKTISKIFSGNKELCSNVPVKLIEHIIHSIELKGRDALFLEVLKTIMSFEGTPIKLFSFLSFLSFLSSLSFFL